VSANISLTAGAQTLRIYSTSAARWNINWVEFVVSGAPPPPSSTQPIPGKIEAESYNTMSGVQTENTDDAGSGLDVGWIDQGDWMDYNVNAASAGIYTVNFRVATPNPGAALQIRKADGTVLLTKSLPVTGDWQTWQTASGTITLAAGAQTLRIYSSASARWNFNWVEFVTGTSSSSAAKATVTEASSAVKSLEIFPNPVSDNFVLQVNNSNTGTMIIQIVDMKGTVMKDLQSDKKEQSTQVYLSANGLSAGTYFVNVRIGDWSQSIQMVKL
jgi:endoglucanase